MASTVQVEGKPTKIRVDSLGINISNDTLVNLAMDKTQHLIVGERQVSDGSGNISKTYNLYADIYGVCINTNAYDKDLERYNYALYVDGPIYCNSLTTASGVITCTDNTLGPNTCYVGGSGSNCGCNFWLPTPDNVGIYYPSPVILGNKINSVGCSNTFSIIQTAIHQISNAQFSIQNLETAQFRIAIIGSSNISPSIINTKNTPIEFHSCRNDDYFAKTYSKTTTDIYGTTTTLRTEVPNYQYDKTGSNAPHLAIDVWGNVGIHTNTSPLISYPDLPLTFLPPLTPGGEPVRNVASEIQYINDTPVLKTLGTLYATKVVVDDIYTGEPAALDSIYIRRVGVTLSASQIIPGPFAIGSYIFPTSIGIGGPFADPAVYMLNITGSQHISDSLVVDNNITAYSENIRYFYNNDYAFFNSNVFFNKDVTVQDSLKLYGGIYTPVPSVGGSNVWSQIQFTVANPSYSNINLFGTGITTPGRFGVGINPYNVNDTVNHQLTIAKDNQNIFELEMKDTGVPGLIRAVYIGHPQTTMPYEGSTVFATPSPYDVNYNSVYTLNGYRQNFYFFPGANLSTTGNFTLTPNSMPALSILVNNRVGINTMSANAELHVNGNAYITSNVIIRDSSTGYDIVLAKWQRLNFPVINMNNDPGPYGSGIMYYDPQAPYVGVNVLPDTRYGMTVAGGLKADAYYTNDNRLISNWLTNAPGTVYNSNLVGIGVNVASVPLDIKSMTGETVLRLNNSDYSDWNTINFNGHSSKWLFRTSQSKRTLNIFDDVVSSNIDIAAKNAGTYTSPSTLTAVYAQYNTLLKQYQVSIGCSESDRYASTSNTNPNATLTVKGSVSVLGDVYIAGNYFAKGQLMWNALPTTQPPVLEKNDVFLGGGDIYLNPNPLPNDPFAQRIVAIGYTTDLRASQRYETSIFRVFSQSPVIAKFTSSVTSGFLQVVNYSASRGIQFGFTDKSDFTFTDLNNNPYISFINTKYDITGEIITEKSIGINTTAPSSMMHVYSILDGANMFKLTKYTASDQLNIGPELNLEKLIGDQSYKWAIRGPLYAPNTTITQKLSFFYADPNTANKELFVMTPSGYLGIGNTAPQFGVDVMGIGKSASLRLLSIADTNGGLNVPEPQLILQSGDPIFGLDNLTDYRIMVYDKTFKIESDASGSTKTVLYMDQFGYIGIGTDNFIKGYECTIGGTLNVLDSIYINGSPLFSSASSTFTIGVTLITLNPNPQMGGGVIINNPVGTSLNYNLFQVYSGNNGTMGIFDSSYADSTLVLRNVDPNNSKSHIYRVGFSNSMFKIDYTSNMKDTTVVSEPTTFSYLNALTIDTDDGVKTPYYINDPFPVSHVPYPYHINVDQKTTSNAGTNGFNVNITGRLSINSSTHPDATNKTPSLTIGTSVLTDVMGSSHLSIMTSNLGIGTNNPTAFLDLITSSNTNIFNTFSNVIYNYSSNVLNSNIVITPNVVFYTSNGTLYSSNEDVITIYYFNESRIFTSNSNVYYTIKTDALSLKSDNKPFINIKHDGLVGIGTIAPISTLDVAGTLNIQSDATFLKNVFITSNLTVYGDGTIHGYFTNDSDRNIKRNILPISNALTKVKELTGYTFTRIDEGPNAQRSVGLIAQEVENVLPEAVRVNNQGIKGVAYGNMVALLVEAIKELSDKLDNLQIQTTQI